MPYFRCKPTNEIEIPHWRHCLPGERLQAAKRYGESTNNYIEILKECYLMMTSDSNSPTVAISLTNETSVVHFPDLSWQGYQPKYTDCDYAYTKDGKTVYVSNYGGSSGSNHTFGCNITVSQGIMPLELWQKSQIGEFYVSDSTYGNTSVDYFIDNFF